MFLYSGVFSPQYLSRFTFQPMADRFILTPTRLLWEAFNHAAITREDNSLLFPLASITRYSFEQLNQLGRQWIEQKCQSLEMAVKGLRNLDLWIVSPVFYR